MLSALLPSAEVHIHRLLEGRENIRAAAPVLENVAIHHITQDFELSEICHSVPPLDALVCQGGILNTIISPMSALYSVNCLKMRVCLFICQALISERPLICLFHYTLELCTSRLHEEPPVCWVWGSDVRFVRQQRCVTPRPTPHETNVPYLPYYIWCCEYFMLHVFKLLRAKVKKVPRQMLKFQIVSCFNDWDMFRRVSLTSPAALTSCSITSSSRAELCCTLFNWVF